MKQLKIKTTSKKSNFEVFIKLSTVELNLVRGGNEETPPDELDESTSNNG